MKELGRVSFIDWIENLNIATELLLNESYPVKFESFQQKIVQMRALQVFHTIPYKLLNVLVCLPNPHKLSILGDI